MSQAKPVTLILLGTVSILIMPVMLTDNVGFECDPPPNRFMAKCMTQTITTMVAQERSKYLEKHVKSIIQTTTMDVISLTPIIVALFINSFKN